MEAQSEIDAPEPRKLTYVRSKAHPMDLTNMLAVFASNTRMRARRRARAAPLA